MFILWPFNIRPWGQGPLKVKGHRRIFRYCAMIVYHFTDFHQIWMSTYENHSMTFCDLSVTLVVKVNPRSKVMDVLGLLYRSHSTDFHQTWTSTCVKQSMAFCDLCCALRSRSPWSQRSYWFFAFLHLLFDRFFTKLGMINVQSTTVHNVTLRLMSISRSKVNSGFQLLFLYLWTNFHQI